MVRNDGRGEIQHYVPRFLLRGFLREPSDKDQTYVFDKHDSRVFPTNIANIAAERGFYEPDVDGAQGKIEAHLFDLENNTKSAFEELIKAESLAALSGEQLSWLSAFIATQQLRTKHFREVVKCLNEGEADHIRKLGFDPKEVEGFELIETEDDLKEASLVQLALQVRQHSDLISTKASCLVRTTPDNPFWVSDHPVVMHNDRQFGPYGNIGLAVPGIQIYLPLTSTLLLALWCTSLADSLDSNVEQAKLELKELLVLRVLGRDVDHEEISAQIERLEGIVSEGEPMIEALVSGSMVDASRENVTFYNHLQVKWAHRYLMSSLDEFALAEKMIADNPKYRTGLKPTFG